MTGGPIRGIRRYLLIGSSSIALLAGAGGGEANAQNVQQLEAQMQAMQAQMQELQRQVAEAKAAAAEAKGGGGDNLDLKLKWKGAPELSSTDGKFKFKVRGRIMTDYNGINQDYPVTGDQDISAVELRRARLGVEGVVFYDWKYKFEVDFASDTTAIKDAYMAYANWAPWETAEIRFGNQYVYNSMEQITSSRFITFMERAAFEEAFFLERQIGVGVLTGDKHWSFQTGYYGAASEEQGDFSTDTTAASVRATVAPINFEANGVHTVLHLGASYRHRDAGTLRATDTEQPFRYRARPDLHLADRFVATPFFAEDDDMFVLEGAFVWNSFSMQGEYAQLKANPDPLIANVTPTYNGWYVDASWYITGETRNYEASTGEFGRTKVKHPVYKGSGGWGAWQIAGRYDTIDLGDKAAAITNFGVVNCAECGEQRTWLVGLNWLLTDYTALKFNYTQSDIKGGINNGADIKGFGMRAQVDW
jgi:phosphate-selective porin OprO/OprP